MISEGPLVVWFIILHTGGDKLYYSQLDFWFVKPLIRLFLASLSYVSQVLERHGKELLPRGTPMSEMEALAAPWLSRQKRHFGWGWVVSRLPKSGFVLGRFLEIFLTSPGPSNDGNLFLRDVERGTLIAKTRPTLIFSQNGLTPRMPLPLRASF